MHVFWGEPERLHVNGGWRGCMYMTVIKIICISEHTQPQATEIHKSKHIHRLCATQVKVTCNVQHIARESVSLAGWRGPVTHSLYGYCALVHHTMCSTQNVDWAGMDRWKQALCLYWRASPLLLAMVLKGSVHMMSDRNYESGNVTNYSIDRWNLFCHMQQPFHQGGRVMERTWLLNLS